MTTAKQNLLELTIETFVNECVLYNNPKKLKAVVSTEMSGIGTTIYEKVSSLEGLESVLKMQKEQTAGMTLSYKTTPISQHISADENTATIAEDLTMCLKAENETIEVELRISIVLEYINAKWLVVHWHASLPEKVENKDDTWGFEALKQKTVVLEQEIAERTAELVLKNKELEIENALEKVRSRSMAMQKSEELKEVIKVVFEQLVQLKINVDHAGFIVDYVQQGDWHFWIADENEVPSKITHPFFKSVWAEQFNEAKEKGTKYITTQLNFEEKNKFYKELLSHIPDVSENAKYFYFNCPGLAITTALNDNVSLYIENFSGLPYTTEENNIVLRFGKVFQQTYTRFLDLQKSEAQAREAQIETALEKVRSVALSLKKSDELLDVAEVLYHQLFELGFNNIRNVIIDIHIDDQGGFLDYDYSPEIGKSITLMSYNDHPIIEKQVQKIQASKDGFFEIILEGDNLKELIDLRIKNGEKEDQRLNHIEQLTYNLYSFGKGEIGISTFGLLSEDQKVLLKRFRNVFTFAYKRYSDLIDAEKRAREAKIEASLEKVRSVALGLTKSDQMLEVAQVLYEQLLGLGFSKIRNAIIDINNDDGKTFTDYDYSDEMKGAVTKISKNADDTIKQQIKQTESSNDAFFEVVIEGEELQTLIETRIRIGEKDDPRLRDIDQLTYNLYSFGNGSIGISNFGILNSEQKKLLKQFRNVFTFAYKRYGDLLAAEIRTREAQIDIALERVRSRTLAMQNSDELAETAAVLFNQMVLLGIEPNRLFIGIIKDEIGDIEAWATNEDGTKIGNHFTLNIKKNATVKKMYDGWKQKKKAITIVMEGTELKDYFHYLAHEMKIPFKGGLFQKRRVQTIAYFGQGLIGMASPEDQSETTAHLLERFAAVFNLTYTRFNDLKLSEAQTIQAEEDLLKLQVEKQRAEEALNELQMTQKQLIQAEKMASLGELTAGIAHEIQNPLNFVNNFSEVSNELIEEIKEERTKNKEERDEALQDELLEDISKNLEKINHHGKRADAIVKGMLQHSRSSSGTKEPTDINKLADEYLRLAYHGLRAKDKSFNANLVTNYDETIGRIYMIPQDIGRVILNLITNAFYACTERSRSFGRSATNEKHASTSLAGQEYEPIVTVSTKKLEKTIEVSIKDNANGIPTKVLDKIFQPFFTTKPTGQGTGLGLSLAYDIVKAHGGELKVETKENVGTEFIISIPINE